MFQPMEAGRRGIWWGGGLINWTCVYINNIIYIHTVEGLRNTHPLALAKPNWLPQTPETAL